MKLYSYSHWSCRGRTDHVWCAIHVLCNVCFWVVGGYLDWFDCVCVYVRVCCLCVCLCDCVLHVNSEIVQKGCVLLLTCCVCVCVRKNEKRKNMYTRVQAHTCTHTHTHTTYHTPSPCDRVSHSKGKEEQENSAVISWHVRYNCEKS